MQVIIKPNIPYGSYNTLNLNLNINSKVDDIQEIISEKFHISKKQQILKLKKNNLSFLHKY